MSARTLLLTGATGLVGGELLRRFQPTHRILAVTRGPKATGHALRGDVTLPGLGLGSGELALVRRTVTDVIHCAADTRFGLPLDQARLTNVAGTRHVLELARECARLRRFAHVSTVFVVGRSTGSFDELPLRHDNGFLNTYQQSKYEAEDAVLQAAAGGLPAAIFRLSTIAGDSRTGRVQQFNYVHRLLRLFPRSVLPVIPAHPDARIDLIPTDWAGDALHEAWEHRFGPGRVFHLCGGEDSPTVAELIDVLSDAFATPPPRLVPLADYQAYAAEARRGGDRLLTGLLTALDRFLPHMGMRQVFRSSLPPPPPARGWFPNVVRYCIDRSLASTTMRPGRAPDAGAMDDATSDRRALPPRANRPGGWRLPG